MTSETKKSISDYLEIPWLGIRPDLIIHPGPLDGDGQRSWVVEDPVRGNNYRLGYTEGELLFRLAVEPDPERALAGLYASTALRPAPEEVVGFIKMLQRESLAILPKDEVVNRDAASGGQKSPSFFRQILQGSIYFRVPLLRPDAFLNRTLPLVAWLWSLPMRYVYLFCGLFGLLTASQEIELYLSTINYLFTPQGVFAFFVCLVALKAGHEFAHAYTAKSLGLHVRSMGMFFILLCPMLYTDTTDVWKVPDRKRRMWVAAAGVLFELVIAGLALLLWALSPDGIFKSLMFFLSGTSIVSSVLINLNPGMRYDGYYILMDYWGIDNLRPRSFALLRHAVRKWLLDWRGPAPEYHPARRRMLVYGFYAMMYRLFIGVSIAVGAYYLFLPVFGLLILFVEFWLFLIRPLWMEIKSILANKRHLGSKRRIALTFCGIFALLAFLIIPIPRLENIPCLLLYKDVARIEAPAWGRLTTALPEIGETYDNDNLVLLLTNDALLHEIEKVRFDLEAARMSIKNLGGGGEEGAYRNWLQAEEKRLAAESDKLMQLVAQLEIRAPIDGKIVDINDKLAEGAFVNKGAYLFTIADTAKWEVRAYVHENLVKNTKKSDFVRTYVRFPDLKTPVVEAVFKDRSRFPVSFFPNEALYDVAGGPVASVVGNYGRRPMDAYFAYNFDIKEAPMTAVHGMPTRIWLEGENRSILLEGMGWVLKGFTERGLF